MTSPANANDTTGQAAARRPAPTPECNPRLLDDLKCKAQGVAAQAAYNAAHIDALTQARAAYDAARSAYGKARTTAAPIVAETRHQLTAVIDQLKCLINDRLEVDCLDRAWDAVVDRLRKCGETSGCYFTDDCDFDDDVKDCRPEDVPARKADIQRRTEAAEKAFADLIKEPTELATRVAALKTEVAAIAAAMAGDAKTTDFKQLYARALVARRKLSAVWRGFEHTNAYVDCLCCALTCQLKGHTAIAILTGVAAVHACYQASVEEGCRRLRENTVDEVMAEYLRICAPRPDDGYDKPDRPGYDKPDRPGYDKPERPGYPEPEKPKYQPGGDNPEPTYPRPPEPPGGGYPDNQPPFREYEEGKEPPPGYKYDGDEPPGGGGYDRDRNRYPDRDTGRSGD
ncbi:hypothetical protein [Actinoplanes solisilvae]|uniref:hypothetical protein n=1 Tax=Actinoplanes solisilvae TaxID=2486853 RepID=UPI000FD7CE02|nr:hypothetical protein [Actinoplanes solisilvae]